MNQAQASHIGMCGTSLAKECLLGLFHRGDTIATPENFKAQTVPLLKPSAAECDALRGFEGGP